MWQEHEQGSPVFPASGLQHISDLHSTFALRAHHDSVELSRSMVDISLVLSLVCLSAELCNLSISYS